MPINSAGTPATAKLKILPLIGKPSLLATDLLAKRTAAAPSVTWLEFPAVVVPSFENAGLSFDKP